MVSLRVTTAPPPPVARTQRLIFLTFTTCSQKSPFQINKNSWSKLFFLSFHNQWHVQSPSGRYQEQSGKGLGMQSRGRAPTYLPNISWVLSPEEKRERSRPRSRFLVIICYMSTKVELEEGEGRGKVLDLFSSFSSKKTYA